MQDRPTAEQLLEAVAAFLREQVVPSTRGPLAFHARVAANALDIARREIALAPAAEARERALLVALLGADAPRDAAQLNRLLCERIDADAMDLRRRAWPLRCGASRSTSWRSTSQATTPTSVRSASRHRSTSQPASRR